MILKQMINITKKSLIFLICIVALIFSIAGITGCSKQSEPITLNVLAAGSLTNVLNEVNDLFHHSLAEIKITAIYAASGDLATQIENGAPADVFISASAKQMDRLQENGLLKTESRLNLLGNRIILAVPHSSTLNIQGFEDLPDSRVQKIAMGDPEFVPAGTYGLDTFKLLDIDYENLLPKMILGSNVGQVLSYLESESVDAGILFATDVAISEKVRTVATAPDEINKNIVYPAAIIAASRNHEAAEQYLNFLAGNEAKVIFEKYGFLAITE